MEKHLSRLFIGLAILGAVLPLSAFAQFVWTNGFNAGLFLNQLVQTPISRFFALDVLISGITFWVFVFAEGQRLTMRNLWFYVLCTLLAGVSLGLPLFLFFRERKLRSS